MLEFYLEKQEELLSGCKEGNDTASSVLVMQPEGRKTRLAGVAVQRHEVIKAGKHSDINARPGREAEQGGDSRAVDPVCVGGGPGKHRR